MTETDGLVAYMHSHGRNGGMGSPVIIFMTQSHDQMWCNFDGFLSGHMEVMLGGGNSFFLT